jgi:serine O-acetyltransferase
LIITRADLRSVIEYERSIYVEKDWKKRLEQIIVSDWHLKVFRYLVFLRKTELYHNNAGIVSKCLYIIFRRKANRLGAKLGIEAWDNTFGKGLTIFHPGNIVVNGMSHIGNNLKLHGSNCIGNSGKSLAAPVIGDNVRLGVGAAVIGDVYIADDVTIAAGAVVVKSCYEKGAVLAGVPAEIVKHSQ